jgi:hypothetical protein
MNWPVSCNTTLWAITDGLASASELTLKKDRPVAVVEQYYLVEMNWPVSHSRSLLPTTDELASAFVINIRWTGQFSVILMKDRLASSPQSPLQINWPVRPTHY